MNRVWRLMVPALVFAAVGLLLVLDRDLSWPRLRYGLAGRGFFALALQLSLSAFLLAITDDVLPGEQPLGAQSTLFRRQLRDISGSSIGFATALRITYLVSFLPLFLFSLGLGLSLSAICNGLLETDEGRLIQPSELVMTALWVAGAAYNLFNAKVGAYLGFTLGFAAAAATGEYRFNVYTDLPATVVGWGLGAAMVSLPGVAAAVRRDLTSDKSRIKALSDKLRWLQPSRAQDG